MQRLLVRLSEHHQQHKSLTTNLYQTRAGYSGELIVDRILSEVAFPPGTKILRDLTLEVNPEYLIQLDTLILTPSRAILLEIKHYAGTVQFDEQSGKTIKISADGEVEKFDCILHQLDRAKAGLEMWFKQKQFRLPIEPILIMANPNVEIQEFPESMTLKYAKQLPRHIRNLLNQEGDKLTESQMETIAETLFRSQIRWKRKTACERFNIAPRELKKGVLCLECNGEVTRKMGRTWLCEICGQPGDSALEQAVADWYLLISPTLRNRQLKYFLELNSASAASIVFSQLRLNRTGKPPSTVYTWDYNLPLRKNQKKPT
ncbi:nuclease-related domain-containing protein [Sporosarcina sp. FSL W7-1349]|uniref:nuclease-related domain-containing protein n=1 Tax=Sporosarcina sp. FSL W7-1349 TaxID=2921561 RepID=UPI0030FC23A2